MNILDNGLILYLLCALLLVFIGLYVVFILLKVLLPVLFFGVAGYLIFRAYKKQKING